MSKKTKDEGILAIHWEVLDSGATTIKTINTIAPSKVKRMIAQNLIDDLGYSIRLEL